MSLADRLQEDVKDAMRAGDKLRRSVIRYVRSAIHNEEISRQSELDDDGIIEVLFRQAQQRRESIEAYGKGGRHDLVAKEEAELAIILEYLPEQLSTDEISEIVKKVIAEAGAAGPQDMGKVMGQVMPQVKGRAQGREVSAIAARLLK